MAHIITKQNIDEFVEISNKTNDITSDSNIKKLESKIKKFFDKYYIETTGKIKFLNKGGSDYNLLYVVPINSSEIKTLYGNTSYKQSLVNANKNNVSVRINGTEYRIYFKKQQ